LKHATGCHRYRELSDSQFSSNRSIFYQAALPSRSPFHQYVVWDEALSSSAPDTWVSEIPVSNEQLAIRAVRVLPILIACRSLQWRGRSSNGAQGRQ
jgi:hypothetical protein